MKWFADRRFWAGVEWFADRCTWAGGLLLVWSAGNALLGQEIANAPLVAALSLFGIAAALDGGCLWTLAHSVSLRRDRR